MNNLDLLMKLEEYFSLEDYANFNMVQSAVKTKMGVLSAFPTNCSGLPISHSTVRVTFKVGDTIREILLEKPYKKYIRGNK